MEHNNNTAHSLASVLHMERVTSFYGSSSALYIYIIRGGIYYVYESEVLRAPLPSLAQEDP
eukprot:1871343-Pyramimonas_sp.AAC.1